MERLWRNSGVALGKHWKLVLAAAVLISVLLGFGLQRLDFATGQDSYLNSDSQVALDNVAFQDQFGGEAVVLLFSAEDGHDVTDIVAGDNLEALRQLQADLEAIDEAYAVITPYVSLQFSDALLKGPGRNALIGASTRETSDDAADIRAADVALGLARLNSVENQELSEPAWVENLMFGNDNYELTDDGIVAPADADRVIRLSQRSTFPNHQTAVGGVVLNGNASLDELAAGTDQVLEIVAGVELEGFEITPTGSPVYLQEINDYLKGGMLTLGIAAFVVMAVVLLLLFPVRWRLLPLLSVVFGVLWSFSILGWIGIDLSLVTISGLPILIGLGIDFAIQIHNRVEEEVVLERADHPMSETLANLVPALLAAMIGAALAFLALQVSQVPMIRDFGVMLAIGVAMLVVAGVVIPTAMLGIREWRGRTEARADSKVERLVVKLGSLSPSFGIPMIVAAAVLFVIGVAIEGNIRIESDPLRWIDQDSEVVADVERLTDETEFASTLGVLVEANNVLDDSVNEVLWSFVQDAEARADVVSSSSLVGTMGKIIVVPGATPLTPTSADMVDAAAVMPPPIARALLAPDGTATQVNLRLVDVTLEQQADIVAELETDLAARLEAVDLDADSILLRNLGPGQEPIRAVPSGLAVVGVGLLENLSANRALLTYVSLAIVALWLVIRYRSVPRMLLALVPVILAVGISTIIVAAFDLTLSPLTTVSGPLVIATCSEFSVLILTRYLEERQRGFLPREACDLASARTGRAFFTSAATTIGGFAVLIASPLPLLRDFGIIVTMNVAVALLAALIVMPPMLLWADAEHRRYLAAKSRVGAVRLSAPDRLSRVWAGAIAVVLAVVAGVLLASADSDEGQAQGFGYFPQALPTTTLPPTTTTTTEAGATTTTIDVSSFGEEPPEGIVGPSLFTFLTGAGATPQEAVCAAETLLSRFTEDELIASGIATFGEAEVVPVVAAALDCQIDQQIIDDALATARGE